MRFFGHANLQQNELQNAVLSTLTSFPISPKVGQIAFVNSVVYICISLTNGLPVWVPLTRELTAYTHNQSSALDVWTITHNLNTTSVNVQVFDQANLMIIPGEIEIVGPNQVNVRFDTAQAGRAVVLTGHFDGTARPTYAYTHFQSAASSTWTVLHGLGYYPVTRVFVGNQEVQPASITHDSSTQLTISFTTPQAGYARLI